MFISWHQKIRKGLYHFALAIFAPSPCLFLLGSKHSKQFQTSIHPRFGTGKAGKALDEVFLRPPWCVKDVGRGHSPKTFLVEAESSGGRVFCNGNYVVEDVDMGYRCQVHCLIMLVHQIHVYIYVLHVCYYSFLYNIERFEFKHTYLYGVCYMFLYIYIYTHTWQLFTLIILFY